MEQALAEAFRLVFDANPRPMLVFDRETLQFVMVNRAASELYGWTCDELLAMTLRQIRRAEEIPDLEFALEHERRHSKTTFSRLSRHATKDGRLLDVEVELARIICNGRPATLAVVNDLTGTADAERRFRILVERSAEGICVIDDGGKFVYLSPGAEQILGIVHGELDDVISTELVHPEDRLHRIAPPEDGETVTRTYRVRHKSGAWRWIESTSTNLLRDPGIRAFVSNFRDVTARVDAEHSIRRSEANFRALIERLPTATVVHRAGRIVYVNPAGVTLLAYERLEDMIGRSILEFIHPEDHAAVRSRMDLTDRDGGGPTGEARMLRRDGSVVVVEGQAVRLEFDGEPANVVLGRDVSERRELFARMAMADRMLSVGTLAAGVAHEINNPLAYVVSNLELLANELPALLANEGTSPRLERHEVAALVADAREGAERVSAIVRDLRALSRPTSDTSGPVDVASVLVSSIKMAHNELRHRARVVQTYADKLPRVQANASRLGQVFLNLLVNAAHAIPEGHADTNEIRVRTATTVDRRSVTIEIEDTGAGIPAHIMARIFDPFFTTKPVGVGIGLGLSISHQIVQSLGGEMSVTSAEGHGSRFRITLPATAVELVAEPVEPETRPHASARILMIDDEIAVGRAVRSLLGPEHDVVPLTRAKVALARLTEGEEFDVILCDLMMPEMSGIEFYEQLVRQSPEYGERVVFVTGGACTEHARDFLIASKRTSLEKPFTEAQLRRAIESVRR